jgi:NAD(P)H-dependent nitrite reductase small subunit
MINDKDGFKKICKVSDLREKEGKRFLVDDVDIAVFKVDGNIYALSNICAHQHTPLIYDGFIEKSKVVCPVHGWEFDLETGNLENGRRGLKSFDVKVLDDDVYVNTEKKEFNW